MDVKEYRDEAQFFINTAFALLSHYESSLLSNYEGSTFTHTPCAMVPLKDDYALRINEKGQLSLIQCFDNIEVLSHSYNNKYSQITYIGKLLSVYLEHLQRDDLYF